MLPLADIHCHLLAGLDDGPRLDEDALAMCRMAYDEGTRAISALAHQNERWSEVTPQRIREAAARLASMLHEAGIGLDVFPCAEVMLHPEIDASWRNGQLLSMADRGQYLLVELPHGLAVDVYGTMQALRAAGVRPIVAHPEREELLLHEPGQIERLIEAGCLVQVSSGNVTDPRTPQDARALKSWFQRGIVHVLGSDGHSTGRRAPRMAAAYRQICRWAGSKMADRVCSTNGMAILHGLPMRVPKPVSKTAGWLRRVWRGA